MPVAKLKVRGFRFSAYPQVKQHSILTERGCRAESDFACKFRGGSGGPLMVAGGAAVILIAPLLGVMLGVRVVSRQARLVLGPNMGSRTSGRRYVCSETGSLATADRMRLSPRGRTDGTERDHAVAPRLLHSSRTAHSPTISWRSSALRSCVDLVGGVTLSPLLRTSAWAQLIPAGQRLTFASIMTDFAGPWNRFGPMPRSGVVVFGSSGSDVGPVFAGQPAQHAKDDGPKQEAHADESENRCQCLSIGLISPTGCTSASAKAVASTVDVLCVNCLPHRDAYASNGDCGERPRQPSQQPLQRASLSFKNKPVRHVHAPHRACSRRAV